MPSIHELISTKERATIEVSGLALDIVYQPNRMTMRRMNELTRRAREEDAGAVAEMIPEILVSWDLEGPLEDDEGNELVTEGDVVPVDSDTIEALPLFFVTELLEKLQEVVANGKNPTKASNRSRKR